MGTAEAGFRPITKPRPGEVGVAGVGAGFGISPPREGGRRSGLLELAFGEVVRVDAAFGTAEAVVIDLLEAHHQ